MLRRKLDRFSDAQNFYLVLMSWQPVNIPISEKLLPILLEVVILDLQSFNIVEVVILHLQSFNIVRGYNFAPAILQHC